MKQFISFVIKEAKHIIRDKRTMLMLFGMPTAMMLLFGFAITNDVRNVRTIIVMSNADYATQEVVDRLGASEYFTISKMVATPSEAGLAIHCRWCRSEHGTAVVDLRQCGNYEPKGRSYQHETAL